MVSAHLKNSKFAEDVPRIAECFDNSTKLRFRNPSDPQYIRFGGVRDKGLKFGIRSGQLRLEGSVALLPHAGNFMLTSSIAEKKWDRSSSPP